MCASHVHINHKAYGFFGVVLLQITKIHFATKWA